MVKIPIVPFFISHRGCPHRCIFCDQEKIAGSHGTFPSAAEIREKVAAYRRTSGCREVEVAFYGGSFTSLPQEDQLRLLQPLQELLAAGEVSSLRISTRPDALDAAAAAFLRASGVATVELGVQSMDDAVLEQSERGHCAADVEKAVACLKGEGITVGLQLMPGLPGDSGEISVSSLMRVLDLQPDFLRIYPTVVVAGTPLSRRYAEGSYCPLTLEGAVRLCKILLHRALLARVPVVRIGLQPTTDLSRGGAILAGPYHPAFRQLVEAELCFDLLDRLILPDEDGRELVSVSCSPSRIADVVGQKRSNIRRLLRDRGVRVDRVRGDCSLTPFEIRVENSRGTRSGNIVEDLWYI
ncbi:MAG: radical SAM protein [Deltaproteobacteria bacterium]|nr:radical SAM protein [Deltaproteobacteria bacterium]